MNNHLLVAVASLALFVAGCGGGSSSGGSSGGGNPPPPPPPPPNIVGHWVGGVGSVVGVGHHQWDIDVNVDSAGVVSGTATAPNGSGGAVYTLIGFQGTLDSGLTFDSSGVSSLNSNVAQRFVGKLTYTTDDLSGSVTVYDIFSNPSSVTNFGTYAIDLKKQ